MVHGTLASDGYLRLVRVDGNLNGDKYLDILSNLFAILKRKYKKFFFMHDGAPAHTIFTVTDFINSRRVKVLPWPFRSPDLNIIENVWHSIIEKVYYGPQYYSKDDLWKALLCASEDLQKNHKDILRSLYTSISKRLIDVIKRNGDICNYWYSKCVNSGCKIFWRTKDF